MLTWTGQVNNHKNTIRQDLSVTSSWPSCDKTFASTSANPTHPHPGEARDAANLNSHRPISKGEQAGSRIWLRQLFSFPLNTEQVH